jgi:diguanylate cyclase (GGDEF)-like protein
MGRFFIPGLVFPFGQRAGFDPRAERALVAEVVVRSAAALVSFDGDPQALIERKCHMLTQLAPHIVLAWTWFGDPGAQRLQPQAVAGAASAYARGLVIERNRLSAIGPAFRTLAGQRLEPFNVSRRSLYGPWRFAAREHGVRSVLALPLSSTHDERRGLFVLYSDVEDYFDRVGVGLFEALGQLFSALLSMVAKQAELSRAAHRDALTGLPHRGAADLLAAKVRRLTEFDPPAAVALVDLDHFKSVNDTHGHAVGDAVLCAAAERLQAALRQGDTLIRWGGEEFCVVLPGTDLAGARSVAGKLRASLERSPLHLPDGTSHAVTSSVGYASVLVGEPLAEAVGRADAALYQAKHAGRNQAIGAEG